MSGPLEVKVCIVGDSAVGKTSLSTRYCHGEFSGNTTPTIGASFLQRRVVVDNAEMSLQIWDTAGQERFRSMAPMYYRGAKAAICVFDVTSEDSFRRVSTWVRDLKAHADPNVVICLAANKCDMTWAFDKDLAEEEAIALGGSLFLTSALTGDGVQEVFENLARSVFDVSQRNARLSKDDAIKLGQEIAPAPTGCC
ncbi:P-loop containing nucleoside triphosphate hydrolase protein [Ochromonadaceae sp. CCMP2298]|nr:P-loop containing nucleoside triphosphate hydrolase protein [Ochromonadaceae sp. CCMP2298]